MSHLLPELEILKRGVIDLHRGPHGGGDEKAAPVTAFGAAGLIAIDSLLNRLEVLEQIFWRKAGLAELDVNNAAAVSTELQFAGLNFDPLSV